MNWIFQSPTRPYYSFAFLFIAIIMVPRALVGQARNPDSGLVVESSGPMASEQGYVNDISLRSINSLPSTQITSLEEAETYVRQVAEFCGVQGPILAGQLLPRLVEGEWAAAQDPSKLVSDDRLADAFNFLSNEFRVPHQQRVTGADVLQFRTTMSAIYPHVFSPKRLGGSRPVAAMITLQQMVFNGGVPEGAKKYAQNGPKPGSFKADPSRTRIVPNSFPPLHRNIGLPA